MRHRENPCRSLKPCAVAETIAPNPHAAWFNALMAALPDTHLELT
jgi:hypothetical protein